MPTVSGLIKSFIWRPPSLNVIDEGPLCSGASVSYEANRLETMRRSMRSAQRWYAGSPLRSMEEVVYVGVTHTLTRREDAMGSLKAAELIVGEWLRVQSEESVSKSTLEYYRGLAFPRDLKKVLSSVMRKYLIDWYRYACRKDNPSVYWVDILRDGLRGVESHMRDVGVKTPPELRNALGALGAR